MHFEVGSKVFAKTKARVGRGVATGTGTTATFMSVVIATGEAGNIIAGKSLLLEQ